MVPWQLESAKECVTTHLSKQLALKLDGCQASHILCCQGGCHRQIIRIDDKKQRPQNTSLQDTTCQWQSMRGMELIRTTWFLSDK